MGDRTDEQTVAEIAEADAVRQRAYVAGDADALMQVMAQDCRVLHGSGLVEERDAFAPSLVARLDIRDIAVSGVSYRIYGDLVIATGAQVMSVRQRSEGPDAPYREARANFTTVWEKRDGRWRLIHQHNTRVPKDIGH